MQEYLTVYISGYLEFPETVSRQEEMTWAGKALTQQLNEYAALGWEIVNILWISDREMMVTFKRENAQEQ